MFTRKPKPDAEASVAFRSEDLMREVGALLNVLSLRSLRGEGIDDKRLCVVVSGTRLALIASGETREAAAQVVYGALLDEPDLVLPALEKLERLHGELIRAKFESEHDPEPTAA